MCYVTVVLWDGLDRDGDICSRSEECVGVRRVDMRAKEHFFRRRGWLIKDVKDEACLGC